MDGSGTFGQQWGTPDQQWGALNQRWGTPTSDGISPTSDGISPTSDGKSPGQDGVPSEDKTSQGATWRAVCFLRSCRRTFLFGDRFNLPLAVPSKVCKSGPSLLIAHWVREKILMSTFRWLAQRKCNRQLFFKIFWRIWVLCMGRLIPLFWTSGWRLPWVSKPGWIPRLPTLSLAIDNFVQF